MKNTLPPETRKFLDDMRAQRRADLTKVFDGFTFAELEDAFEIVKPEGHWKNPIDKIVDIKDPKVNASAIIASIGFFCGGGVTVHQISMTQARITAAGYFCQIGA